MNGFAYLATQHVAERLGLSPSRVVQLANSGRLPALRDSLGNRLFVPEMVERFASSRGPRVVGRAERVKRFQETLRANVEAYLVERSYEGMSPADREAFAVGFREGAVLVGAAYIMKSLEEMAPRHGRETA